MVRNREKQKRWGRNFMFAAQCWVPVNRAMPTNSNGNTATDKGGGKLKEGNRVDISIGNMVKGKQRNTGGTGEF